jgi:RNA polymerase sigma factor (sigma-70 family)
MDGKHGATVARDIQRLFRSGTATGIPDGELLARFVERGDEAAFEALMIRHGPMILGVCRQLLHDPNDAADAFQATLLILVRKAGSVRVGDTLGPWFYGVAYRVAVRARTVASRRHEREQAGRLERVPAPERRDDTAELSRLLHDELNRLPGRLRAPIVLCHLEGLTHPQAAQQLGCPVGTVCSRLARGRAMLRTRLERRGLDGSTLLATWPFTGSTPVPTVLMDATLKAVMARGAALAVSAPVVALTKGVLMSLLTTKLKVAATAVVCTGLLAAAAGTAVHAYQAPGSPAAKTAPGAVAAEPTRAGVGLEKRTNPKDLAILEKLKESVSLNLERRPLGEAIESLHEQTGLNIVLNPAIATALSASHSLVTLIAERIRVDSALNSLLGPLHLTYKVEDGRVVIEGPPVPFPEQAPKTIAKTYYVGDLISPPLKPGADGRLVPPARVDMKPVIDLITSSVAPGTWRTMDDQGKDVAPPGPNDGKVVGSIKPFDLSLSLIVSHTGEVHKQVANFLRQLRRIKELQDPARDEAKAEGVVAEPERPRAEAATGARLVLNMSGPKQPLAEKRARYMIVVANVGTSPARNVLVEALLPVSALPSDLPEGARFDPATRRLSWVCLRIDQGEKAVLMFRVHLALVGAYQVVGEARAEGVALVRNSFSSEAVGGPDVAISVKREPSVVDIGDEARFVIKVVNSGRVAARRVSVSAEFTPIIEPLETKRSPDHRVVFPVIENLGPGASTELVLRFRATASGVVVCRAFLKHDELPQTLDAMAVCLVPETQ